MLKARALLFASAALVAGTIGTASAGQGGEPASVVPAGCTFANGMTTCITDTTNETTPGVRPTATDAPRYDLQFAVNWEGNCAPGAPTPSGLVTTTTTTSQAHQGAPGSKGRDRGTVVSTSSTTTQKPSPGRVKVDGTSIEGTLTGLAPNTDYNIDVRCGNYNRGRFTTDSTGTGSFTGSIFGASGLVQLELSDYNANRYFNASYAVTAPFLVPSP